MTFVTSWKISYRKFRFYHFQIKYTSNVFLRSIKAKTSISNRVIFQRLDSKPKLAPGVSKFCNTIMKSMFSSQLCVNTILVIEIYGSHWLEKNLFLNQRLNKICCWSVKSQWYSVTAWPVSSPNSFMGWKDLWRIYQQQTTMQSKFGEEWTFSIKAKKIKLSLERTTKGSYSTYDPIPLHSFLGPKSDKKGSVSLYMCLW